MCTIRRKLKTIHEVYVSLFITIFVMIIFYYHLINVIDLTITKTFTGIILNQIVVRVYISILFIKSDVLKYLITSQ